MVNMGYNYVRPITPINDLEMSLKLEVVVRQGLGKIKGQRSRKSVTHQGWSPI